MGAIFFIVFLAAIAALGVALLLVGIIGTVICRKRRRENQNTYVRFPVIFTVIIVIGCLTLLPPIGFASFIVLVNAMPPDGFVETDILIEEDGYQDTQFTADGVVYKVTEYYAICDQDELTPVFTYKTKGFMNGSQCGNYYSFESSLSFSLVCDELGAVFCPADKLTELNNYYSNPENLIAYFYDWEEPGTELTDTVFNMLWDFLQNDMNTAKSQEHIFSDEDEFTVDIMGNDGIIYTNSCSFIVVSDKVYYVKESFIDDTSGVIYKLVPLSEELSSQLLAVYNQ